MKKVVWGGIVTVAVLAASASAGAFWWFPMWEIQRSAVQTLDGQPGRYMSSVLVDRHAPETCVLVLTDTQTGHFAAVAVPPASCAARRPLGQ